MRENLHEDDCCEILERRELDLEFFELDLRDVFELFKEDRCEFCEDDRFDACDPDLDLDAENDRDRVDLHEVFELVLDLPEGCFL